VEVEEEDRRPTFLKSRTSSIRKEGVGTQILNVTTYQKVVGRIHWSSVTLDSLSAAKGKKTFKWLEIQKMTFTTEINYRAKFLSAVFSLLDSSPWPKWMHNNNPLIL
jgi:hypothetical protein